MAEALQFDPTSEDAANSPLSVMDSSYKVVSHSYPAPQLNVLYASSIDTEGEIPASRRYSNRQISMTLEMVDATGNLLSALQAKVTKIAREGGTLKRTMPNGDIVVFDLLSAETFDPTFNLAYVIGNMVQVDLVFAAKPFGRGAEVTLSAHNETSLPCLVFTETAITGDVPALGRLTISDAQAVDQAWAVWGLQCLNYDSSSDASLFYQAESRTPFGAAVTAAGPSGASGAGSNVIQHTNLATSYQAIMGTQASGGGNHLKHVGDFTVYARVQVPTSNAGTVTVAMEWGEGDFRRYTRNASVDVDPALEGNWVILNLGQIHPTKVVAGTQRWEGRFLAKSTSSADDINFDCLFIVPVTEGSGEVSAPIGQIPSAPSSFTAYSDFTTESGAITGDSLTTGGTWSGSGDADDFSAGAGVATRTATSDTATSLANGRLVRASSSSTSAVAAQVDLFASGNSGASTCGIGLLLRYTDTSNFLAAVIVPNSDADTTLRLVKRVLGTSTTLTSTSLPTPTSTVTTLKAVVSATGAVTVTATRSGATIGSLSGSDSVLATGGTLASGTVGLVDWWGSATASTRTYDNFLVWAPPADAAMFASQSLEIRNDRVVREDSGGTLWVTPTSYEGDYLLIPPAGAEGRTNRFFVKASRGLPESGIDAGIDDISATLSFTPRWLVVP